MPNITLSHYKKVLNSELKQLHKTLQKELKHKENTLNQLSWCLEDSHNFLEFLSLKNLGRNPLEKVANTVLYKMSIPLWKKSIYKKVTNKIIKKLRAIYLPREFKEFENHQDLIAITIEQVNSFFKTICFTLKKGSLIDLMNLTSAILKCIRKALNTNAKFYLNEKNSHDRLCLRTYNEIRSEVINHPYNILIATLIAVKANFIDSSKDDVNTFLYGFFDEINEWLDSDILALIDSNNYPNFDYYKFINCVNEGKKKILYELDNCGEVVFDFLLIELLLKKGHSVVLCAKLNPILNDVTVSRINSLLETKTLSHLKDYIESKQLSIIHANNSVVGKNLFEVTEEYKEKFKNADLVMLKGQGHFLNMPMGTKIGRKSIQFNYKKPIFYMFTVKSEIVEYAIKEMYKNHRPTTNSIVLKYNQPSVTA
jgi:uncharacterized protein with ATP-grasp and redox domains